MVLRLSGREHGVRASARVIGGHLVSEPRTRDACLWSGRSRRSRAEAGRRMGSIEKPSLLNSSASCPIWPIALHGNSYSVFSKFLGRILRGAVYRKDLMASIASLSRRWLEWVPQGSVLPDEVWASRQRWVMSVLVVQAAAIVPFALAQGYSAGHALVEASIPAVMAASTCACRELHPRREQWCSEG